MSGLAIVIKGADFSGKNLGKVTLLQDVDVTSIKIVSNSFYEGIKAQLSVTYEPSNTSQNVCTWQVVQGNEYAEIDAMTGLLRILEGAENADVMVRATSVYNSDIYAEATIRVTYRETVEVLEAIKDIAITAVDTNKYKLSAAFEPENTAYTGIAWSIVSGSAYVSLEEETGELTVLEAATEAQNVVIRATSTHDVSLTKDKALSVQWKEAPSWDFSKMVGTIDMTKGLGEALCGAEVTMFIEFSDDSSYDRLSTYNQTVIGVPMPAENLDAMKYYTGAGLLFMGERNYGVRASINGFVGLSYSSESKMSVPVKKVFQNSKPLGSSPSIQGGSKFIVNNDNLIANGNSNTMEDTADTRQSYMQYLSFGFAIEHKSSYQGGLTCEEIYTNEKSLYPDNGEGSTDSLKPTKIIVVPGTFSSESEILEVRDTALIDIRFDTDGVPYNAGSGGELSIHKLS